MGVIQGHESRPGIRKNTPNRCQLMIREDLSLPDGEKTSDRVRWNFFCRSCSSSHRSDESYRATRIWSSGILAVS